MANFSYKSFMKVLSLKYELIYKYHTLIGFEILEQEFYEINESPENFLDKCYIIIGKDNITLNEFYLSML
jgi:hypothetical protein